MAAAVALDKLLPHTTFFGWFQFKSERTAPVEKAARSNGKRKGEDATVDFDERHSSCIINIKRVVDTIIWFVRIRMTSNLTLTAYVFAQH